MRQDGIVLLQLTCSTGKVGNSAYHWYIGFGRNDNRFNGDCLSWTAWNIVHDVQRSLWHGKELLDSSEFLAAMATLISMESGISDGSTYHRLDIPIASQRP